MFFYFFQNYNLLSHFDNFIKYDKIELDKGGFSEKDYFFVYFNVNDTP